MIDRLARQLSFLAPSAVMSAWAVVMLHTIATGHINRLLSPLFRSWVMAAAIVLLILSLLHLVLYDPPSLPERAGSRWRQILRWLVLMVPVLAASVLSPAALSSTTLSNRSLSSTAGVAGMPTWANTNSGTVNSLLAADPSLPVPVDVMDLITLSRNPAKAQEFAGRKVRMVGFVADPKSASPKLLRWMMWCCAADAQPVSIQISGHTEGDWKDTEWVEVIGTATFPSTLGHAVPDVQVDTIKPTTEPDEPYLSP